MRKRDAFLFMMEDSRPCLYADGNDLVEEKTKKSRVMHIVRRGTDVQRTSVGVYI